MLHIPIKVSEKERNLSPHCPAPPPPSKELYQSAANTCLVVWRHTDLRAFPTMIPFSLFHKESKCKEKQTNKQTKVQIQLFYVQLLKNLWGVSKVYSTNTLHNFFSQWVLFKNYIQKLVWLGEWVHWKQNSCLQNSGCPWMRFMWFPSGLFNFFCKMSCPCFLWFLFCCLFLFFLCLFVFSSLATTYYFDCL